MAVKSKQEIADAIARAASRIIRKPQKLWRTDVQNIATDLVDTLFDMSQYIYKTQFDERLVAQKSIQITLESFYPLSQLNDTTSSVSNGVVTNNSSTGEFKISTTTATDSYIKLQSNRRGEYVAGLEGQASIGLRLGQDDMPVGSYARWGYYDDNDGLGWEYDTGGLKAFYRKNGATTYISASEFNNDKLDGEGPSGLTHTPLFGAVYLINFAWYGYGDISWNLAKTRINEKFKNDKPSIQPLHTASNVSSDPKISNPNLPLTVELDNNGASSELDLYVGGRQFSILGKDARRKIEYVEALSGWTLTSSANVWEPLAVIRRNSSYNPQPNISLKSVNILTNQGINIKTTLYNQNITGNFSPPTSYSSNDAATEFALTGSISGTLDHQNGFQVPPYIIATDAVVKGETDVSKTEREDSIVDLPDNKAFVIWGKYSGTAPTISMIIRWNENK